MSVTFSINRYDESGHCREKCILIHSKNDDFILRFENIEELQEFKHGLEVCVEEIQANW